MKSNGTNVILLVSGWLRKTFNSKEQESLACPHDILKLIDQFVCQETLHLLPHSNDGKVKHIAFHLEDILSTKSTTLPTARELPGLGSLHAATMQTSRDTGSFHLTKLQLAMKRITFKQFFGELLGFTRA